MRIETSFLIAILVGLVLKFIPLVAGNIVVVLALMLLIAFYMFGAFYLFSYQKIKNQKLGFSIAAGFFLAMPLLGILYKIMYWPGSLVLIRYGIVVAFLFLAIAIYKHQKETVEELRMYYRNMIRRCAVIAVAVSVLFVIPSHALVELQYRNDPEMARLLIRSMENPANVQYQHELFEYRKSKLN